MNKDKAIKWCNDNLGRWPGSTVCLSPGGWSWKVRNQPYQFPEYILQSINLPGESKETQYIERSETTV